MSMVNFTTELTLHIAIIPLLVAGSSSLTSNTKVLDFWAIFAGYLTAGGLKVMAVKNCNSDMLVI